MTAGKLLHTRGPYTKDIGAILRVFGGNNENGTNRSEEFVIYTPDQFDELADQVERRREQIKQGLGYDSHRPVIFEEFYEIVPANMSKLTKLISQVVETKAKAQQAEEKAKKTALAHRLLAEVADGV